MIGITAITLALALGCAVLAIFVNDRIEWSNRR